MFAIIAAILFGLTLILQLAGKDLGVALNPATLTAAGLLCLALHLGGVAGSWRPRPWRGRSRR